MKKQKLRQITRIAALSVVGALPILAASKADAQVQSSQSASMPPIVSGSQYQAETIIPKLPAKPASNPLMPMALSKKASPPPIVIGNRSPQPVAAINPRGQLGSGIVKQITEATDPAKQPRIARTFSPAKVPVRRQGSGSRNIPAPAVQLPSPFVADSGSLAPSAPVISGSLLSGDNGGSGGISVGPNYFDSGTVVNPVPLESVVGGCNECGGAGNCSSCGQAGASSDGFSVPRQVNQDYGTFGSVSSARRYGYFEALYMTREDGDINGSNFNPLGEFDFGGGIRVTLGRRSDMTQGREISYFGTADIENRQVTNDSRNRLNALFTSVGGIVPADLSAFNGASTHIQFKESNIHSIEINRVRWGWDVLKSFVGWRYVYFDDEYQLDSTAPNRDIFGNVIPGFETGRYRIDTVNHLIGAHIGAELFYDVGYRFSVSGVSKYGVYANINEVDNFLVSDGTTLLNTESNDANIATTYELSILGHYQIRPTARLRFGYNGMFIGNVATVADNFSPFVSPFTGFNASDSDDAFIHGFTFGLEIFR